MKGTPNSCTERHFVTVSYQGKITFSTLTIVYCILPWFFQFQTLKNRLSLFFFFLFSWWKVPLHITNVILYQYCCCILPPWQLPCFFCISNCHLCSNLLQHISELIWVKIELASSCHLFKIQTLCECVITNSKSKSSGYMRGVGGPRASVGRLHAASLSPLLNVLNHVWECFLCSM